jgi:hypothetical protein
MAIRQLNVQMLLAEHRFKPIRGNVICVGRNTVFLTDKEMDALLNRMDVPKRPGFQYEVDDRTMNRGFGRISQESFFGAFTDAKVKTIDVSDYEGAEIVCDLQDDLPAQYLSMADFVYDGGSLDNIFDVAATLRNMSKMLKPTGRIMACNNGGPNPVAYLTFSADWFMDFFAINQYADCKTYVCNHDKQKDIHSEHERSKVAVYSFNPYVENAGGAGYDCSSIESTSRYQIAIIAEKRPTSTDHRNPIQKHYRTDVAHRRISVESAKRFLDSPRPLFSGWMQFDPAVFPRIDSSEYPEQIKLTALVLE